MITIKNTIFYYLSGNFGRKAILCGLLFSVVCNCFSQAPKINYPPPQSYIYSPNVTITPLTPNTNTGGAVPATIYGTVTTVVDTGFNYSQAVAIGPAGDLYVSDWGAYVIKKINLQTGKVTRVAGNTSLGSINGPALSATFHNPNGIVFDASGNLYVADEGNNLIRKITPGNIVSTLAGVGTGKADGPGETASFNDPRGLAIDAAGNIYVADAGNGSIRKIDPFGNVSTVAGGFNSPTGVDIDASGNLYVVDAGNKAIKKISKVGVITTIAPGLSNPREVRIDGTGNYYVTDQISNAVKRISPSGLVTIVAAGFNNPVGLVLDGLGNLYVGDSGSRSVKKIVVSGYTIDKALPPGLSFDQTTGIISGTPISASLPTDYTITAYNGGGSNSTRINIEVTPIPLISQVITFPAIDPKTICSVDFPTGASSTNSTIPITYTSSNINVATVSLSGMIHIVGAGPTTITASQSGSALYAPASPVSQLLTVTSPIIPSVSIAPDNNSICSGTPVTFTATVSNLSGIVNPTYQWQVNGTIVGSNSAIYVTTTLTGTDVIKCMVTNNDFCPVTTTATSPGITVLPVIAPTADIQSSVLGAICMSTPVTFTATLNRVDANTTYQWRVNGIGVGSNSATYTNSNFADGDKITCTFGYTGTSCFTMPTLTSSAITVNVISPTGPPPSVTITASANNVYAGLPVIFTATPSNVGGNITYQWQVNGINSGTNSSAFTTTTLNNGDKITCTISTNNGCTPPFTSLPIIETILPPLTVTPPNAFTPNGDNINDVWEIAGLNTYPNCVVRAYNRYGILVFQSKGYNKPWDGLHNGRSLPVGIYYYVIDLAANQPKVSGYVAIIR